MLRPDQLVWGKPCKHHISNKDGLCLRHIDRYHCMLCCKKVPADTDQDEFYLKMITAKAKTDPEVVKQRRVAASMRWNAKNKAKTDEYRRKYQQKPEVKAKVKELRDARYYLVPQEERRAKWRKWYADRKARKLQELKDKE